MVEVLIRVELSDESYRAYEREAERRDTTVEELVELTVRNLWEEMVLEEQEGTDHPVIPC